MWKYSPQILFWSPFVLLAYFLYEEKVKLFIGGCITLICFGIAKLLFGEDSPQVRRHDKKGNYLHD